MISPGLYKVEVLKGRDKWGFAPPNTKGNRAYQLTVRVLEKASEDAEDIETVDSNGKPIEPPVRTIFLYVTKLTWERTLRELQSIGYPHSRLIPNALNPGHEARGEVGSEDYVPGSHDFGGVTFLAECKNEEWQGKMKEKWSIYRSRVGPMSQEEEAQFEELYGQEIKKEASPF